MSKYNFFAREANERFLYYKLVYEDVYTRYKNASEKYFSKSSNTGFDEIRAINLYTSAKSDMEKVRNLLWKDYDKEIAGITSRFKLAALHENDTEIEGKWNKFLSDLNSLTGRTPENPTPEPETVIMLFSQYDAKIPEAIENF